MLRGVYLVSKDLSGDKNKSYYPSKTYRIYPVYYQMFYACLSIIERDELSEHFIKKYYNYQEIPKIPNSDNKSIKGGLLDTMIRELKNAPKPINKMSDVINDSRIQHIILYFRYKGYYIDSPRRLFPIRVSPETNNMIKELSKHTSTIGEVIEIAIAYHLTKASDTYYDLITFALQHQKIDE